MIAGGVTTAQYYEGVLQKGYRCPHPRKVSCIIARSLSPTAGTSYGASDISTDAVFLPWCGLASDEEISRRAALCLILEIWLQMGVPLLLNHIESVPLKPH